MHSPVTVARMTRYDCLLEEQVGRGRRRDGRREAAKAGGREGRGEQVIHGVGTRHSDASLISHKPVA